MQKGKGCEARFLQQYEFNTLKEKESIYNYELYFKKINVSNFVLIQKLLFLLSFKLTATTFILIVTRNK